MNRRSFLALASGLLVPAALVEPRRVYSFPSQRVELVERPHHEILLRGNTTIDLAQHDGGRSIILIKRDRFSPRTVTWPKGIRWLNREEPALCDGTTVITVDHANGNLYGWGPSYFIPEIPFSFRVERLT